MTLKEALSEIRKDFGSGAVIDMSGEVFDPTEMISTGVLNLDMVTGGGIPRGKFTEIIGPESSGKSTLCLHIMTAAQKIGPCLLIDTEHSFDPTYAERLGLSMDQVLLCQPQSAEEALEIAVRIAATPEAALIIVDSVAGLVTTAELNGQMGDAHIAGVARLMAQALRKITPAIGKNKAAFVFVNQLRAKIGGYGSAETTTGGNSLKYFASLRIDLRKIDQIKQGTDITGSRVRARIIKSKCAVPMKQAEMDLIFGQGFSVEGSVLDVAVAMGLVTRKGAYYMDVDSGENLGQGKPKTLLYLKSHPELLTSYYNKALSNG